MIAIILKYYLNTVITRFNYFYFTKLCLHENSWKNIVYKSVFMSFSKLTKNWYV